MHKQDDRVVRVIQITQRHRTIRLITLSTTTVLLTAIVLYFLYHVLSQPPWLTLALTALAYIIGPAGVLTFLIRRIRRYTKRTASQLAEYQKDEDQERSSSGLETDGTDLLEKLP